MKIHILPYLRTRTVNFKAGSLFVCELSHDTRNVLVLDTDTVVKTEAIIS
jgi:hypothetical protein